MRTAQVSLLLLIVSAAAFAQLNTSTMDGLVTDPQGALIPRAEITIVNAATGQTFNTLSDERGHWVIPSLSTATYSVTISAAGFKKATKAGIKMDAGIPATVNIMLEVGTVAETVEVVGGAEVLQIASATVSSNLVGQQVRDLPIPSRNATDLIVTLPGTQTPAGPRNTTINGLPQATMNMTLDGVNIQDNLLKNGSGGAFYPVVYPRTDAIEEVSVTTSASGAESLGEGAAQIKFVTRRGTNELHGGFFIQERNTFFNANTYFNNIDGLARDKIILHQIGANLGGPIIKNKLFLFFNYEVFRFPQTWNSGQRTVLNERARSGVFTYMDTTRQLREVNLYQLAAAGGFASTPDPIIANTLSQIADATTKGGSLTSRIATNNDYNRSNFSFLAPGVHKIDFPHGRLDYDITSKHHFEATGSANPYRLIPDGINNTIPVFPGSGTVLGSSTNAGQREAFWTGSVALRSAWSTRWTSEIRFGMSAGNVLFFEAVTPALFAPWKGYAPTLNYVSNPFTRSNFSRRNNPVKQLSANASRIFSGHLVNFGGTFSQINEYVEGGNTQFIPGIAFGVATGDPVNFGSTGIFNTTNLPNSSPADQSNAAALYTLLTGRVSQITRSVVIGDRTKTYGENPAVDRLRQREYGLYMQDSWRVRPTLTLNYGLRLETQNPFQSLTGTYTRPGYEGLFGISGVGNLFQPNARGGSVPSLTAVSSGDVTGYPPTRFLSPTVGAAWVLPDVGGPLGWLIGHGGQSVLRAGVAVTSTREQFTITGVWGNNQGRTINTSLDPVNNSPDIFGPAGSVLFRNATLPVRNVSGTPSYPLPLTPGTTVNEYDPNLKARYVTSWNVGFQRSLTPDTVVEVRYVGNKSARAWTGLNLNEVNIVENGFIDEFRIAQNNLAIRRAQTANSNDFGNAGLPGQRAIPIIQTALGTTSDVTTATQLSQGEAGRLANAISGNSARMARLTGAGYPPNFFIVNPATGGSAANLTTNQGGTTYNALTVEVRRRMSKGVLAQASYSWSHSLSTGNVQTLRNRDGVTFPSAFDQRHAVKLNWIYELPFGRPDNPIFRKAVEGWQISGISRIQSGTPSRLISQRQTFNTGEGGVVLRNMTTGQLQEMMSVRKLGNRIVTYLPQPVIDNTLRAFQLIPGTPDPNAQYIAPAGTAGEFGHPIFLYGPWLQKWDVSLVKRTRIREKQAVEFRATALNVFNVTNFFLVGGGSGNITVNSGFGQTRSAYTDINSTNDPGSRVIEFTLRYSF